MRCGSPCHAGRLARLGNRPRRLGRALADPVDSAIASAEIASGLRRGAG